MGSLAMIATGRVAPVMSAGKDDEEIRKRIVAFLLAGFPVGCIDNVEHPFGNEVMCTVLTQAVYRDRVLGRSELATLPTGVTWTITGNNLQFVGDITTRVLPCDLDPQDDLPNYAAGTFGPRESDQLLERDGRRWLTADCA